MDERRKVEIEKVASDLQRAMWICRWELVGNNTPSPFDLLHPWLAAHHLGVEYREDLALDRFGKAQVGHEVAGFFDRNRNLIAVSLDFELEVQRFTAAHEIGHFLLHPSIESLHRDRPINAMSHVLNPQQSTIEREANYFAGSFLMPRKQVEIHFKKLHGCFIGDYRFTESEAWRLSPADSMSMLQPQMSSRRRAIALADYKPGMLQSLARCFNVSNQAMAIRLEELGLRADWP